MCPQKWSSWLGVESFYDVSELSMMYWVSPPLGDCRDIKAARANPFIRATPNPVWGLRSSGPILRILQAASSREPANVEICVTSIVTARLATRHATYDAWRPWKPINAPCWCTASLQLKLSSLSLIIFRQKYRLIRLSSVHRSISWWEL